MSAARALAPPNIQAHPSLRALSLRALSLSAPAAHSEKVPDGVEQQPAAGTEKSSKPQMPYPPPAQVVGTNVVVGDDFLKTAAQDGFIVDKSLICKAFLHKRDRISRICLPRGFGKSFNLAVIAGFFNPATVHDCKGGTGIPYIEAAREQRRRLFSGSLLEQYHPDFVEKYFGKIPVVQINFKASMHLCLKLRTWSCS
ncbi:hypothetical protein H4R19_002528 [Coemansia spiralis]|nr:hypothetical protein H4R19_002528 [Coemansia spiralis]